MTLAKGEVCAMSWPKRGALLGVLALFLIQFVPCKFRCKPTGAPVVPVSNSGNAQVVAIFRRSCVSCHSSNAGVPWYGHIAPASWLLARHVNRGIKKLDFTSWSAHPPSYDERQGICDEMAKRDMPLRSYTMIHRSAVLSTGDVDAICSWADSQ